MSLSALQGCLDCPLDQVICLASVETALGGCVIIIALWEDRFRGNKGMVGMVARRSGPVQYVVG